MTVAALASANRGGFAFVQQPIQITSGCKSQRRNFQVAPSSATVYNPRRTTRDDEVVCGNVGGI